MIEVVDEANNGFVENELVWAAIAYLRYYGAETKGDRDVAVGYYPFDISSWAPQNPRNCLKMARHFIDSELERLDKC
jgi:hypothetical protein